MTPRAGRARIAPLLIAALAVLAVVGMSVVYHYAARSPALGAAAAPATVELRVSREFGARTLLYRRAEVTTSSTVMGVLTRNARVDAAYGGGFVNSIEGVASGYTSGKGSRADWFYFVNGIQSRVGANERPLSPGDRVWWDYHGWEFAPSVPAVVGQFPAPFASEDGGARRGTTVVPAPGFEADAASVAAALRSAGAGDVAQATLATGAPLPVHRHVVVMGTWGDLAAVDAIAQAAEHPQASGLFARVQGGRLFALDGAGALVRLGDSDGVILATAFSGDPDSAAWLVTGIDAPGAHAAAAVLAHHPAELAGRFGVAVSADGTVTALPLASTR